MKTKLLLLALLFNTIAFSQPTSSGLYFDGDDSVIVPNTTNINSTTTNDRTYESYFKADNANSGRQFIMKEGGATRAVIIYIENGFLYLGAYNRADYNPNWEGTFYRTPINSNVWYHFALVFDNAIAANNTTNLMNENANSALKFYLNGVLVVAKSGYQLGSHNSIRLGYKNEALRLPSGTWTANGVAEYSFGNNANDANNDSYYFQGNLWGFRIWNDVRTATEINNHKDQLILNVGNNDLVASLDGNDFNYLNNSNNAQNAAANTNTSKTWKTNAATTAWETATNWVGNVAPINDKLESIRISTSTNYPIINSDVKVGDLTLDSGVSLTINSNASLDINYNFTNNGNVTVENNGTLLQQKGTANNRSIVYKRAATGINGYDYIYWSSPVIGQSTSTLYSNSGLKYQWNPILNNNNGAFGNTGQGNYQDATNVTMAPGKGYIIRGSNSLNNPPSTINAVFTGIPINGNLSYTVQRGSYTGADYIGQNGATISNLSDNFNLIGNPYPSAINALSFLKTNQSTILGSIDLWTHSSGISAGNSSPFYGTFAYNYNSNNYVTINFTGSTVPGISEIIKTGQAFFVKMIDGSASSASITFDNSMRRNVNSVPLANNNFFKTNQDIGKNITTQQEKSRIWLDLVNSDNLADRTLIGYVDGATNNFDNLYDAVTLPKNDMKIYSVIGEENFSIQGRQFPFQDTDEVTIGVNFLNDGLYKIALNQVDGVFENQTIYLKDALLNTIHNLNETPYSFTSQAGINNNRFTIVYQDINTLSSDNFNNNELQIIKNNNLVNVSSPNEIIDMVQIYDLTGRLLKDSKNVNQNNITIQTSATQNQILIISVTTVNGIKTTKKLL
jgi:hypothetical protein